MIEIKDKAELDGLLKTEKYLIVDFFATWCQPCVMLKKLVLEPVVANKMLPHVVVAKIDTDRHQEIAAAARVTGLPTVVFYQDGMEKFRFMGFKPLEVFLKLVNETFEVSQ